MNLIKRVSICFLLLALVTALVVVWQRSMVERQSDKVEIALDYHDLANFAKGQHYDLEYVLQKMKKAGATTLAISEKTLLDLEDEGRLSILSSQELKNASLLLNKPEPYQGGDTYIVTDDRLLYEQLSKIMINKFGPGKVIDQSTETQYCLAVLLPSERLEKFPLYLDPQELILAEALGYYILPRLSNYNRLNDDNLRNDFMQFNGYNNLSSLAFLDEEVLGYGYNDYLFKTAEFLQRYELYPAVIEFCEQKGMQTLLGYLDNRGCRLHSIPEEEMENMTISTAENRMLRAVKERNIRILYLRMFTNAEAVEDKDPLLANLNYVHSLREKLSGLGYQIDRAVPFSAYQVSFVPVILMSLGALAGFILLLSFFISQARWNVLAALSGLAVLGILVGMDKIFLLRKVMALLASIAFPTLAVVQMLQCSRKLWFSFLRSVLWSLAGGILVAALLADTSFFLKINSFSGVKFMHVIPLLLVSLYYAFYICNKDKERLGILLNRYLNEPVLVKYVVLAGIILLAGMVYILRTGNEIGPLAVSGLEIKVRETLEHILLARPRTSEFLLGHPAFVLVSAYLGRNLGFKLFPLLLLASIGQISIVSTFTHVHTPFLFSLLRVFNGAWIGLLLSCIALGVVKLIEKGLNKYA